MAQLKMVHVFIAAVAAGATYAAVGRVSSSPSTSSPPPPPAAMQSGAQPKALPQGPVDHASEPGAQPQAPGVQGAVLEVIDVPQYTYARVGETGSEGEWVAVPTAKLQVGQRIVVRNAMQMTNFTSTTLKRTFASIWFGSLDDGSAPRANAADPAGSAAGGASAAGPDPHAASGAPTVEVAKVERAPGANGKTVVEAISNRTTLAGKSIRVRGTVVKMMPGVLGKTYLHLRDGSGDASTGTNDLSVTTDAAPAVGTVVVLEGTLALDRDIGSGYKFPTILEDAKVVTP